MASSELVLLNEAELLRNIVTRFRLDLIYTNVGSRCLVALNPFKLLPIYGDEDIDLYHSRPQGQVLPPHVYAEAEAALRALQQTGRPQAIIICGDSGAGKTEATKLILQYLSCVASDGPSHDGVAAAAGAGTAVGDCIVDSTALMEAFGNAATTRNHNSSRFGKLTSCYFDSDARQRLCGGRISHFLLEKSRVVKRPPLERSFHVFYQLCAGAPPQMAEALSLRPAHTFRYLGQGGCVEVSGMDDGEELALTREALEALGLGAEKQLSLFSVVAGVLHLGDASFSGGKQNGDDGSSIADGPAFETATRLLGVDEAALAAALVKRVRELPSGLTVDSPLSVADAERSRDALAKAIYSRLFDAIVDSVNGALESGDVPCGNDIDANQVGILDIFGFESAETNGFEQLLINCANETLQALFNKAIFLQEELEYAREDVEWPASAAPDNTATLELLTQKPMGLLPFMDSECLRGAAGSDASLVAKLHRAHRLHPRYAAGGLDTRWRCSDGSPTGASDFIVKHFAGPVVYRCEDFLEKNRDDLMQHVEAVMAASGHPRVAAMFASAAAVPAIASATDSLRKQQQQRLAGQTVAARFVEQLGELIEQLECCDTRFVRCVKSNSLMAPSLVDKPLVLRQLAAGGVMAALEVCRAGYPTRMVYAEFNQQFRMFGAGATASPLVQDALDMYSERALAESYLANELVSTILPPQQIRFGKTKLFMQADVIARLESIRKRIAGPAARRIQRWYINLRVSSASRHILSLSRRLHDLRARARVEHVLGQSAVRTALENASAAARRAQQASANSGDAVGSSSAVVSAVDDFAAGIDALGSCVAAAAAQSQAEAEERAELFAQLDNARARLKVVATAAAAAPRTCETAQPLTTAVLRAERALTTCRDDLLRVHQAETVRLTRQSDVSHMASGALRRSMAHAEAQVAKERINQAADRGMSLGPNFGRSATFASNGSGRLATFASNGSGGGNFPLSHFASTGSGHLLRSQPGSMLNVFGSNNSGGSLFATAVTWAQDGPSTAAPERGGAANADARRVAVQNIFVLVEEAERACTVLAAEQQQLEAARGAASQRLQHASSALEEALMRADVAALVLPQLVVEDTVRARAALSLAEQTLRSGTSSAVGMAEATDRAAEAVAAAEVALAAALASKEDEDRRADCRAALLEADAVVCGFLLALSQRRGGSSRVPDSLQDALAATKEAIEAARAAEIGGPTDGFVQAVAAVGTAVHNLQEENAMDESRREGLRRQREAQAGRLAPCVQSMAALAFDRSASRDPAFATALTAAKMALAAAQAALAADDELLPSAHALVGEAIAAVAHCEQERLAAGTRRVAAQREAAAAKAALGALRRRLTGAHSTAAVSGMEVENFSRPQLSAARDALSRAERATAGAMPNESPEAADDIRAAVEAAAAATMAAEDQVAAAANAVARGRERRAAQKRRLQALQLSLNAAKRAARSDEAVVEPLARASQATAAAAAQLEGPLLVSWLEDGSEDANDADIALQEAEEALNAASDAVSTQQIRGQEMARRVRTLQREAALQRAQLIALEAKFAAWSVGHRTNPSSLNAAWAALRAAEPLVAQAAPAAAATEAAEAAVAATASALRDLEAALTPSKSDGGSGSGDRGALRASLDATLVRLQALEGVVCASGEAVTRGCAPEVAAARAAVISAGALFRHADRDCAALSAAAAAAADAVASAERRATRQREVAAAGEAEKLAKRAHSRHNTAQSVGESSSSRLGALGAAAALRSRLVAAMAAGVASAHDIQAAGAAVAALYDGAREPAPSPLGAPELEELAEVATRKIEDCEESGKRAVRGHAKGPQDDAAAVQQQQQQGVAAAQRARAA